MRRLLTDITRKTAGLLCALALALTAVASDVDALEPLVQPVPRTITIEAPLAGAEVTSPFEIRGQVSLAPFESNLVYLVFDTSGRLVGQGAIRAYAEMGTPGPFAGIATFETDRYGPGRLEIVEPNAASGAPLAVESIPVTLLPADLQPKGPVAAVTGTVTYRARIALPPQAIVTVLLQEASRAGAPAITLGEQTIVTGGRQVPIPYRIPYDQATIDPRFTYAVSSRITVDGQLRFISTRAYPVITRGNPTDVEIVIDPA